jgi:hypothetical protein
MVAAKCKDLPFRAKRSVVEEWSERDERHGRLCRKGRRRESRETNEFNPLLLFAVVFNFKSCLDSARHDKGDIARVANFNRHFRLLA